MASNPGASILYCSVSRGRLVLSRYADCAGNFAEVTELLLARAVGKEGEGVEEEEEKRMSYA